MTRTQSAIRNIIRKWFPYSGDRYDNSEARHTELKHLFQTLIDDAEARFPDTCESATTILKEALEELDHL